MALSTESVILADLTCLGDARRWKLTCQPEMLATNDPLRPISAQRETQIVAGPTVKPDRSRVDESVIVVL